MTLAELERSLAEGLKQAYVVYGEALPLVEQAHRAIRAAVAPHIQPVGFNLDRFRAGEAGERAIAAARTLPMLASTRCVEIRDLHEGSDAFFAALCEYLQAPSPSTVLVLVGAGFPKVEKGGSNWAVRVKNAMRTYGVTVTFAEGSVAPAAFVVDAARRRAKAITIADADRLVGVLGPELSRLDQEVEKLALYVGDAADITARDIVAVTATLAEAEIWDLTAGLAARDPNLALSALHRLQAGGDDARRLIALVMWQVRDLLRVADLLAAGANDRDITSRVKIRWELFRRVRPVLAAGFPSAPALLRRLATAHRHMNSHRAGDKRILEGIVLEMLDGRLRTPPPVPRPR